MTTQNIDMRYFSYGEYSFFWAISEKGRAWIAKFANNAFEETEDTVADDVENGTFSVECSFLDNTLFEMKDDGLTVTEVSYK